MAGKPTYKELEQRVAALEEETAESKRAEEALRQSEAKYRNILERSLDGIFTADLQGKITYASPSIRTITGYDPEEVMNRVFLEFLPEEEVPEMGQTLEELVKDRSVKGQLVTAEKKDGTPLLLEANAAPISWQGEVIGTQVILRDITKRRQGEEDLRQSEEKFRGIAERSFDGILMIDLEGKFTYISPSAEEITGYGSDDAMGKDFSVFLQEEELSKTAQPFTELLEGRSVEGLVLIARKKDGSNFLLEGNAAPIFHDGEIVGAQVLFRDITKQRQAEEALQKNMENLALALEGADLGVWDWDIQSGKINYDEAWVQMLGYSPDRIESLVESWENLLHPDDLHLATEAVDLHLKGKAPFYQAEFRVRTKADKWLWVLSCGKVSSRDSQGKPVRMAGIHQNIDARKRAEQTMREDEERFRALFEGSLDAIFLFDPKSGVILDANPIAEDMLRRPHEEIVGLHHSKLHPPHLEEHTEKMLGRILEDKPDVRPIETCILRGDGKEMPVEVLAQIIQIAGTSVVYSTFHDIAERKHAEDTLRESEQRFRTLFNEAPVAMWELDASFLKKHVDMLRNRGIEDFMAYFRSHPEEAVDCFVNLKVIDVNQANVDLHKARDKEEFKSGMQRVFRKESYEMFMKELVSIALGDTFFENVGIIQTFTGEKRDVFFKASVVPGCEDTLSRVLASIVDITDKKKLDQELVKIQKLESLGVLAGGIAHDFNNILTGILINISLARSLADSPEDLSEILSDAEKASFRAKGLSQQLLTFAKGAAPIKKLAFLDGLVRDTTDFALSGSNVRSEFTLPDDLWPAEIDEGQIGQVFQNMVINADQAMPEGGIIRIRSENTVLGEGEKGKLKAGKYVRISIDDQGYGIPEKQLERIFDPFFTTKEKGRGLGLATCFSIINSHGGHIDVDSTVAEGTTFQVYLPAAEESPATRDSNPPGTLSGQGRILLVDDEDVVLESVGRVLERFGYEVQLARDGAEGVRLYEEAMGGEQAFQAVIMDLTIPGGMGGKEAVREFTRLDPKAKVIVSSGYSDDPVMSSFREYGFCAVVSKPYRVEDLYELLNEVITGAEE